MKTSFRKSFARDVKKIKIQATLRRVRKAVEEVESATVLEDIPNLSKLSGTTNLYRIRVGDYRIGIVIEADNVDFVRCLPRRDLYRFFP
jgi:mRNA interferase RelE/StbE